MGCTPCKEEDTTQFNPKFHTPKKRIDKLDGVKRDPSFAGDTPDPSLSKNRQKSSASPQAAPDGKNNRLVQVECLDGAGGSGRGKGDALSTSYNKEHMGGNKSFDGADGGGGQEQELRP